MIELGDTVTVSWHWQPILLLLGGVIGLLYVRGWRVERQKGHTIATWRPLTLILGLVCLFLALISPLHELALYYLFARVSQHILLLAPSPALLLVGDPWPILKAGFPQRGRNWLTVTFGPETRGRTRLQQLTPVSFIWFGFLAGFSLWYDPILHNLARQTPWLRTLELSTIFAAALPYWWVITRAHPHLHQLPHFWLRVLYTAIGAAPLKILGGLLLFSETTLYLYPTQQIQIMDVSGIRAQQLLAGLVIWFLGGVTFTSAAFLLMRTWFDSEERKPTLSIARLSTEERLIAPGWEQSRPR
ncbi:MAG: cytochrome c oxidase assembly protein [Chloroflexi bacterium]|nr:cytochrome c oxidase assembly protein [Chloroflexota bacterium]MBP8057764.1 cytochrome c oxidase assembly protein [Chloroflexota bacterium]